MNWINTLLNNPLILIFLVSFLGVVLGRVGTKNIKLGAAAALIVGIFFGHAGYAVPGVFFNLAITMFMATVGLLASRDAFRLLRRYGASFPILAIAITTTGAVIVFLMAFFFRGQADPIAIAGTFAGALTSSPGLTAALEVTDNSPLITIGYTLTYPVGLLIVVFFIQLTPRFFRINVEQEKIAFNKEFRAAEEPVINNSSGNNVFSVVIFFFVIITGMVLGEIRVPLPYIGDINLGAAGGVIITSLIAGYFGEKLGEVRGISLRVAPKPLAAIRDIMLPFALAVIGLNAGAGFLDMLREQGIFLILISLVTGLASMLIGFLLGHYVFHINWIVLAGALCGGMTSTPGLAVAIDSLKSEEVGIGYGAVYPVAVFCMVFFTKLIILFV